MTQKERAMPFVPPMTLVLAAIMLTACGGGETQPPAQATQTEASQTSRATSQQPALGDSAITSVPDVNSTQTDAPAELTAPSPSLPSAVDSVESVRTAQATTAASACATTKLGVADLVASIAQEGNPAANVLDGNLSTRWSGFGKGAYLTADLGSRKQVCSVALGWYRGNERINQFALSVSDDGINFSPLYAGSSVQNLALQAVPVTPKTARYVRLTVNGNTQNDWASVTEFQVLGGPAGFAHPGILVSKPQLDFVKAKIAAGADPWTSHLNQAKRSRYGALTWVPHPVEAIKFGKDTDQGATSARDDGLAAYTLALLWYHTGDIRYAKTAIAILNAYSATLKSIVFDPAKVATDPSQNGSPLQAAWMAELMPRSAEILRYSNSGWAEADAKRFGTMLNNVLLPQIVKGWLGGGSNWNNSMADGVVNIGIYNDDRATFDQGVALWRTHVPETYYLTSDGPFPIAPPEYRNPDGTWKAGRLATNWRGQPEFGTARVNGITQETCRDFGHTQMSLASSVYVAESARIQGLDLYSEQRQRLITSHEFIAKYENLYAPRGNDSVDVNVEPWLCNGKLRVSVLPTWEIVYNHYVKRLGGSMPETARTALHARQAGAYTNLQMSWETLTHAETGNLGAAPN